MQLTAGVMWFDGLCVLLNRHCIANPNGAVIEMNEILTKNHPGIRCAICRQGFEWLRAAFSCGLIRGGDRAAHARLGRRKIDRTNAQRGPGVFGVGLTSGNHDVGAEPIHR